MTTNTASDLETRIALHHGVNALQCMREALEHAAKEIARYEGQFEEADGLDKKARVLNRAINHLCTSVMNNARIDLAADAQAELNAIATRVDTQ